MSEETTDWEVRARREEFETQLALWRRAIRSDLGLPLGRWWVLPTIAAAGGFALALAVGRRRKGQRRTPGLRRAAGA